MTPSRLATAASRADDALRPALDAMLSLLRRPVSVVPHLIGYPAWFLALPKSAMPGNVLGYEGVIVGLAIIDQQLRAAASEHQHRRKIERETLRAIPDADESIVEEAE